MTAAELNAFTQKRNPEAFMKLAAFAAYQIESLAVAIRDFSEAHPAELDTFLMSACGRLRQLSGVLMTISSDEGDSGDVETVWGSTVESFLKHVRLQPAALEDA